MSRRALVALVPVLLAVTAPAAARAAVRLSDEHTFTSWAHPRWRAPVRAAPLPSARTIGSLHMLTEEGEPEVYLLLRETTDAAQRRWLKVRLPGRPNGRTGWVGADALGTVHVTHWALRVDLHALVATLFAHGRRVWQGRIGVGKASTPTPIGSFWVRELLRVPGRTLYGPYAFGTSDYSVLSGWPHGGVVGIHGTDQPWLIPGRPSHGCIRMRNGDISFLAAHLPIGAPVQVVA